MTSERGNTEGEKKRKTVGFEPNVQSINNSNPNVTPVKEEEKEESVTSSEMSNDEFELL